MPILSEAEIRDELKQLPGWSVAGQAIERRYEFSDFAAAMGFVNRVAELAEASDHHPDIDIRYNKVVLALISHDSGGVTTRDVKMANKINGLG
ncbi:MAG TPA: 4a-hydroxytetrahydrobiopterin dehydratase [Terriglobales bacterium]|nr:4a-hydroxytetrahydrobiopterin dehydratase [Terriglobales bacterium]